MKACGKVHKYGDNVDTDVIIPARYLNTPDMQELAQHCMEDIDVDFAKNVQKGDIMVCKEQLRLRFIKRACACCYQGERDIMRYSKDIRKNILQKRYKYRTSYHRVRGSCREDR